MQIEYPSHVRWFRKTTNNPSEYLTGKNGKKIAASIQQLTSQNITWKLEPLEKDFFDNFTPLYQEIIGAKQNGHVHDVYETTLGKEFIEFPYYGLSIFEQGAYVGGTIFSVREDRVAYAYRAYQREWNSAQLKAQPALIAEYLVAEFATQRKLRYVSHGKDRNPYGINSAIGLAIFKLSVGCRPLLTEDYTTNILITDTVTTDALVMTLPYEPTRYITSAYLLTSRANEHKYIQATKYPEQLNVTVLFRD